MGGSASAKLKILSPAKVNLFLEVTGKRSDGYHTIRTLMCPIGIYDTILLDFAADRITIDCEHPDVPENESNLAHRAAMLFRKHLAATRSIRFAGVNIRIEKNIPVAAGLGGGSGNAAAVMLGLNRYFETPFTMSEMMTMGLEIGADTPFFIYGRSVIAAGIGEKLVPYRLPLEYKVLIVYPGLGMSTAEVYKNLDLALTKCKKKLKDFPLKQQAYNPVRHACNDLETVTLTRFAEVRRAKTTLLRHGALGALMSGSGSAVFGLFDTDKTARKAFEALAKQKDWQVFLTELVPNAGCIFR